jgi:hypothetical protein
MAQAMISPKLRRLKGAGILVMAAAAIFVIHHFYHITLHHTAFFTGWLLYSSVIFLMLYNARKKLPFLPLGSSQTWLQFHLYVGWLTVFLFGLHIYPRIPNSVFEIILASLFIVVAVSGAVGIYISRTFAVKLSDRGNEVIYERIPALRREIKEKADQLALLSVSEAGTQTIARFHLEHMRPFLDKPRHFFWHILGSTRPWSRLLIKMEGLKRYLNARELEILSEMRDLAEAKDDLDYHHSLQSCLKYWLFLHIPLAYALLIFATIHAILVHAFTGGR